MRPWNLTLFVPLRPVKDKAPAVTVRLQAGLRRFFLLCATHLPLTLRRTSWVKLKLIAACSFSEKENVVPTGGFFFFALICASLLPSRQME
jgi:hypothetical protein